MLILRSYLCYFMIYSILGWIFESSYCSLKSRRLLNRGFCHGPWLPIYGSGALLMLLITAPFREQLALVYISGFIGATLLELATGYIMFHIFQIRWWDYSYKRFHYHGYICLSSSVAWGFFAVGLTRFLHPFVERLTERIPALLHPLTLSLWSAVFVCDCILSITAAWDIHERLLRLSRLRARMRQLVLEVDNLSDELKALLLEHLGDIRDYVDKTRDSMDEEMRTKLLQLAEHKTALLSQLSWWKQAMLRNNPNASSSIEGFAELKAAIIRRTRQLKNNLEQLGDQLGDQLGERFGKSDK